MPIPSTKVFLSSAVFSSGYRLVSNDTGDLTQTVTSIPAAPWVSGITDLNGDGIADFIVGGPGDDDKDINAGRIYVRYGTSTSGGVSVLPDSVNGIVIDGVIAGDMAGSAVGSITDINGDGLAEILVGAPMMDKSAVVDAGIAFVLWGDSAGGGIDLGDPYSGSGSGVGFAIKGEGTGDHAGEAITSITDLNGDGKAEILVGAAGSNAGGSDSGAAYVVFGKSTDSVVNLTSVTAGTGGYRIVGQAAGDNAGHALGSVSDLNGDGKAEILVGAYGNDAGGAEAGAAYVVFGKSTGTQVDLNAVAAGTGGFRITGMAGSNAGAALSGLGDVNGDGLSDIFVGAPGDNQAYVVFGKSTTSEVLLSDVASGIGGFAIEAEAAGDLVGMSITGGKDFNRDGIADIVIGAPHNAEGGFNAGAVYVVWGGATSTVDLSLVAQGIGGGKIVGVSGSLTGSSVAMLGDLNADGASDLLIGSPGSSYESVSVIFTPTIWQPDINVYGTNGVDVMGFSYGGLHKIGDGADNIVALDGNDIIDAAGGNDTIDGGAGADSMTGGMGDDTYYVDDAGDAVIEAVGGGADTVIASISHTLGANVENLTMAVAGLVGTGNALNNTLNGTSGADTLDGGIGADTMIGGLGNDTYKVDNLGDITNDTGGIDTVVSSIDSYVLASNIENLTLAGTAHIANGNALNNILTGGGGDDTLNGGAGADTMIGGAGNDTYTVDNIGDAITESPGNGVDTVNASISYTLGANVENLTLTLAGLIGTGNALDNVLTGTSGADTLDGGVGADTMIGGLGNDTYKIDSISDTTIDTGGIDTVISGTDGYTLGADIENLTLSGTARHGTGNALVNTLTGTAGADTLDGAGGADTMIGGAGNDTYLVDNLADVTTEIAGGGNDTAIASVDGYTLGAEVENLILNGLAHTGTGNASDNTLTGTGDMDTLYGLGGNDVLDGGAGADTMAGGDGDDTYYIDDINDIVVEGIGGGNDTVVANFSYTLADNIESARVTGTGHSVIGNSGNNHLAGESGDDTLDGGEGDDVELGGDGDDHLISGEGNDDLNGGSGDDVYEIHGGSAHIEDFLGHDTIDASAATGDSYIDLSGDDFSHIEGQVCDLGQGGTTVAPLDVQFLQDLSGSFGDDIANVRLLVPSIVSALQGVQANSMFGSSTFVDKAVSPFGDVGEWVYQTLLPLTNNAATLSSTYNNMIIRYGADEPEAQIESLMQLSLHTADVGFRPDSARFVVLFTDAPFHVAGDGAAGGILTPNNGDAIMDGSIPGTGEDYPLIAQVKSALELANIIPIFAIANGYESVYQGLVSDLGRGTVVTLTADSSNVVAAITAGLTAATVTTIEDAKGGDGNDTIKGNDAANALYGNAGDDILHGGKGDDVLDGGSGHNTAVFDGYSGDFTYQNSAGVITLTDNNLLDGNEGKDTLSGIESLAFANGTANVSLLFYTGTANGDGFTALNNGDWTLHGYEGNDSLKGRNGMDDLYGDAGNDSLYGKAGNDTFTGGAGNDKLYGGDGDDLFLYANASLIEGYDRVYGEAGNDTIRAGSNGTYIGLQEITGIETITADGFTGVRIKASSSDQIFDFSGTTLTGIAAIEVGGGNDTVTGSSGIDMIKGQAGNDRLNGGAGADVLYGGTEADTFVFDVTAFAGRDSVRDFSIAQGDVLELHDILTGYDPVTSAITDFVRITETSANSYVSVDTDGAANGQVWTQIARVDGVLGMTDEAQMLMDGHLVVTV